MGTITLQHDKSFFFFDFFLFPFLDKKNKIQSSKFDIYAPKGSFLNEKKLYTIESLFVDQFSMGDIFFIVDHEIKQ